METLQTFAFSLRLTDTSIIEAKHLVPSKFHCCFLNFLTNTISLGLIFKTSLFLRLSNCTLRDLIFVFNSKKRKSLNNFARRLTKSSSIIGFLFFFHNIFPRMGNEINSKEGILILLRLWTNISH